jgi:predicted TIM-barrel fold metal-dependent hydrolase
VAQRYPDQFIPFMSVNPLRQNAIELIDEYAERGCRGAKFLQNYWAIDLNDERYIPYYEKLVTHDLPLIVHVGSEYTIESDARYEGIDMVDLPLACGVKVIAAHMGLGRVDHKLMPWRNLSRNPKHFDRDYFELLEKLDQHEKLYADISAILAPLRARALHHLAKEAKTVHTKILFGTDFPVPFTVFLNSYDLALSKRLRIKRIDNPFDRYINVLFEYFPPASPIFTNHLKLVSS